MMRKLFTVASLLLSLAACSSKVGSGGAAVSTAPGGGTGGGTSANGSVQQGSPGLVVTTADGRHWEGGAASVAITSSTSLAPASANITFSASAETGAIGVGIALLPEQLLGDAWSAKIDGTHSFGPGLGSFTYYENGPTPTLIHSGTLTMTPTAPMLSGSFTTDNASLASGQFRGSFTVTCYVTADQLTMPGGTPGKASGGAVMLMEDAAFATPFCAPFAKLAGRAN